MAERNEELIVKTELEKVSTKLAKVADATTKVLGDTVEIITEQVDTLTESIVVKTVELNELEENFKTRKAEIDKSITEAENDAKTKAKEARRTASVNLALDIKEDADKAVAEVLKASNQIAVDADAIINLEAKVDAAETATEKAVKDAVTSVTTKLTAENNSALEKAELTNKANNATKDADLTSAQNEITLLKSQLEVANNQIDELRKSMTEMITNQSAPTFNVGNK